MYILLKGIKSVSDINMVKRKFFVFLFKFDFNKSKKQAKKQEMLNIVCPLG